MRVWKYHLPGVSQGRNRESSGCIMDGQPAKITGVGGIRGYDGGKKLSGRKRHLLVDTLGLLLTVTVPPPRTCRIGRQSRRCSKG